MQYNEFCLVSKQKLKDGWSLSIAVFTSIWWYGQNEYDPSPLSRLIGKYGLDVALSKKSISKLEIYLDGFAPPWVVMPFLLCYTWRNGVEEIDLDEIYRLEHEDVMAAIEMMLRTRRTR